VGLGNFFVYFIQGFHVFKDGARGRRWAIDFVSISLEWVKQMGCVWIINFGTFVHYFYLWTFSYEMPYKHVCRKENIKTIKRNKEGDVSHRF
jgi:hypothetical protein